MCKAQAQDKSLVEDTIICSVVDTLPTFPEGKDAMYKFIYSRFDYQKLSDNDVQGRIFIEFVVEKDNAILMEQISDVIMKIIYISVLANSFRESWQLNPNYEQIQSNMPTTRGLFSSLVIQGDNSDVDLLIEKCSYNGNWWSSELFLFSLRDFYIDPLGK